MVLHEIDLQFDPGTAEDQLMHGTVSSFGAEVIEKRVGKIGY
jgi:hypothetical protein